MTTRFYVLMLLVVTLSSCNLRLATRSNQSSFTNPLIFADVPDLAITRVGNAYYMASTTMHMNPGVPIMKSYDLVNWEIISYAYDKLVDNDHMNLLNGRQAYGFGSWAPSIRHHNGLFYVSTFSVTTRKTHIYITSEIGKDPWKAIEFEPMLHDHSLIFDDDGKIYMLWGEGRIRMIELKEDLSGVKEGTERVVIENASAPAGTNIGLQAEGTQLYKHNGYYYMFNIVWPRNDMRTVLVHRSRNIGGPYEGRVVLKDKGIAQGCLIDTPEGDWYAYLFRDYGSVGRIPYLVPVNWSDDGWPVLGVDGKVPDTLNLPASKGLMPGIVASDEFNRGKNDPDLPLVWQWNHNPDHSLWSVRERKGHLRLKTGRVVQELQQAPNTLTQRTFGPTSSAKTLIDVSNMREGDYAGLTAFQRKYGQVGVKYEQGKKYIFMINAQSRQPIEMASIPLNQKTVHLRVDCDYREMVDIARFYYSLDGKKWNQIGDELNMEYTLVEHFMGYRFGLFNYATREAGGFVDFDFFRISY